MTAGAVASNEAAIKNAPTSVLLATAQDIVNDFSKDSTVFDDEKLKKLTRFSHNEIQTGRVIGRGGFCTVMEIVSIKSAGPGRKGKMFQARRRSFNVQSTNQQQMLDMSYNGTEMSVKEYMAYSANKGGKTRYVVKNVADEWVYSNRITFLKGTVDLALEAKYLSSLSHPHIIEIRAVSDLSPFQKGYFIVLDRLADTLPTMLKKWMTTDRQCKGITGAFVGGRKKIAQLYLDRMKAAFGVANALAYLHSKNLVYRDLKPDNIGFDGNGQVRIFDFGLVKELHDADKAEDGTYKLTGFTGSIRYMAPEVGLKQPYNQSVDVYSFSMLLWYMMALEPPYGFYTPEMFVSRVFQQGHRPVTMDNWPAPLCQMMKRSWHSKMAMRPNFFVIMNVIKREVHDVDPNAAISLVPSTPPPKASGTPKSSMKQAQQQPPPQPGPLMN